MDFLSKLIEYRSLMNEVKISGDEHLKIILQDPLVYLRKSEEVRNKILSDSFLPNDYREQLLKEANGYREKVEQAVKKSSETNFSSLLTYLIVAGIGYYLGYAKKSDEIDEKQQFMSDFSTALREELKKYL
jgi:hypothetical protein